MKSLPEGLITTTDSLPSNLDGLDGVEVGDIAQLWRVYNTNPDIHTGVTGHRLENFFWRIWGSEVLLATMSGSMLARLFRGIEGEASAEGLGLGGLRIDKPTPLKIPTTPDNDRDKEKDNKKSNHPPLAPILKKPKSTSSQGDLQKTTRLLLTNPEGESFTRNPSNPPTPVPTSAPTMAGGDMVTAKAKKPQSQTVFVATTMSKNTRRRPVVMRRKSSKSGTTQSALGHSPEVSSPLAGEGWVDFDEGDEDGNEDTLSPLKESAAHDKGSVTPTPKSSARQTQLPESFIATLKAELKAHPPQKPSQPRNLKLSVDPKTNPQANDPDLWYGWYRQPSKDKLIDEPFRKKFAEQVQDAKIAAAQVVETGEFLDEVVTKAEDSYYLTQTPSYTPVHSFRGNTNTNILTPDSSGSCAILTTSSSAETQFLGSGPTPRSSGPVSGASLIPTPSSGSNDATISVSGLSTFRNVGVGVGMGPDVDGNGDGDGEAPQEGNPGSGLKMDVTFEELEELCPMVW